MSRGNRMRECLQAWLLCVHGRIRFTSTCDRCRHYWQEYLRLARQ
jgi:hypothetical protein